MIRIPGMLMIGAAGRNAGKTEFACQLISKYAAQRPVIGLKVTTIRERNGLCPRGGQGCGVCSSLQGDFCLTEETGGDPAKDTSRLLAAGAAQVFWLRVLKEHLQQGLAAVREKIGSGTIVVCESNSLRSVAEPDLFVMVREKGSDEYKESARAVSEHLDREVLSDGRNFSPDISDFRLVDKRWSLREEASALLLAGGGSRRMGRDKSMLSINGRPMIEHIYRQLEPNFREVLISCSEAGKYSFLGARMIPDQIPGQGPLMGIATTLKAAGCELVAVVSCDTPDVRMPLLRRMLRAAEGHDGVVPCWQGGRVEPLFAVYRKGILPVAGQVLAEGRRRVDAIYPQCNILTLNLEDEAPLQNINTVEDFEKFERKHK